MHSNELKHEFLQLRARGATLNEISELLELPKSTLGVWNRQLRPEINRLRALEWELFETEFGCSLEDNLKTLAKRIRRFEEALDDFPPQALLPKDMLRIIQHTRREYLKLRSILLAPLDESPPKRRLLPRPEPPSKELYKIVPPDESSEPQSRTTNDLQQETPAPSTSVTPEVTRGQISSKPSINPAPPSADAVHDAEPPSPPPACLPAYPLPDTDNHSPPPPSQPADAVHDSQTPADQTVVHKLIAALKRLDPDKIEHQRLKIPQLLERLERAAGDVARDREVHKA